MSRRLYSAGGDPPMRWRNCIRPVRQKKGVTLTELARKAGMHTSNLSNLESHNREPTVSTLLRLAWALDCIVDDLIELEPYGREEKFISRCGDVVVTHDPRWEQEEEPHE